MLRTGDNFKQFKNGNINIKLDHDTIKDLEQDEILTISDVLYWADCYFIGDTYCLSNFETGHTVYNNYLDVIYIFPWSYLDELRQGKTVKLIAIKPDEDDREMIDNEFN